MSEREERLEGSLLSLRDPLARVALAASQIARAPGDPIAGILAEGIRDAVGDLDRRIQESLHLVRGPLSRDEGVGDCGEALRALVAQLAPVFAARGRRLEALDLPREGLRMDAGVARRAALLLLRCAGAWTGPGGWLRLEMRSRGAQSGMRVEAGRSQESGVTARDAFSEVARFALAQGAELEHTPADAGASRASATLWFRDGGASR